MIQSAGSFGDGEALVKGQDTKELYAFFKQLATSDGNGSLPQVNPWHFALPARNDLQLLEEAP